MTGVEDLQGVRGNDFLVKLDVHNFSMFYTKENYKITSEPFSVPVLENSSWHLKLLSSGPIESSVRCFICRSDDGPENIRAFYSLSASKSYVVNMQTFFGKTASCNKPLHIDMGEYMKIMGQGNDVLHIECCLRSDNSPESLKLTSPYTVGALLSCKLCKETRIHASSIKNFSNFPDGDMVQFNLASSGSKNIKLTSRLWMQQQELRVLICEQETSTTFFVLKCKVYLLDLYQKKHILYSGRSMFNSRTDHSDNTLNFALDLTKKQLMENKNCYLPNDTLLLLWEFDVSVDNPVPVYLDRTLYDTTDFNIEHKFTWRKFLDHKYNDHRVLFNVFAIILVILSVLPHFFFDSTP